MAIKNQVHYLPGNKSISYPMDWLFFDCETEPTELPNHDIAQPFKLGVALYWRRHPERSKDTLEYCRFTTIDQFWEFVIAKTCPGRNLIAMAHNLKFDFMVTAGFKSLSDYGFEMGTYFNKGHTQIYKYKNGKAHLLFLDNMNYFNISLEKLGKAMGFSKLPMPDKNAPMAEWWTYCQRDVDIMHVAWEQTIRFFIINHLGHFAKTIPGLAMNSYRHRFMPHRLLHHTHPAATRLERDSYRGGRAECFQLGYLSTGPYYFLDANSMYSHVMKEYEYPTKLLYTRENPPVAELAASLNYQCVIANVLISTTKPIFGVRYDKRLTFPVGEYIVTLTTEELKRAIQMDAVKQVFFMALYEKAAIFPKFVDFFYGKKCQYTANGNTAFEFLCKIILNSVYGKFGQRSDVWEKIADEPGEPDYMEQCVDAQTGERYVFRRINGIVSKSVGKEESKDAIPSIASEVAANARLFLWDCIELAGANNCFYCDTDSLLVNQAGYDNLASLIDNKVLGYFRLEQTVRRVVLRGLKDYRMDGKIRMKGVPKKALKVGKNKYAMTYSRSPVGDFNAPTNNRVIWTYLEKTLSRIYEKGIIDASKCVQPLIMRVQDGSNHLDFASMIREYGPVAAYQGIELSALSNNGHRNHELHYTNYFPLTAAERQVLADEKELSREKQRKKRLTKQYARYTTPDKETQFWERMLLSG